MHSPGVPEVVFGRDAASVVPRLVRALGHDSAFVVSDPALVAAGITPRMVADLARDGVRVQRYDRLGRNPSLDGVLAGSMELRGFGPAVIVAIGGGSAIDAAKAIALHAANDLPASELDRARGLHPACPVIAVPTIAGAGAETNGIAVIDDPATHRKRYLSDASTCPRYAVLDPVLAAAAPPRLTAACGIVVLANALESLRARAGDGTSSALAVEAAGAVFAHLPRAVADGEDLDAHESLLLAAHLAGLALAGPGRGMAHALGHALSARYDIADGVALAAVLPVVTAHDRSEQEPAIAELLERIGLRPSLAGLLVPRGELPSLAADALADAVIADAPPPPEAGLLTLLEAAY